jgi:aryl sulfotransferase
VPTSTPPQGVSYLGHITDSRRWENFKHRAGDIFICTPAKCGTTWTQAICAMLISGRVDHGQQPGVVSPWVDSNFAPIEEYLQQVEAQTHRRYLKTHTPFDGIPYHSDCTYLVILRDPRDAYLSGLDHRANMRDQALAANSFPTAFSDWLNRVREPGTWDRECLDSMVHFFKTYWQYRQLSNVHLFHYSDMKRDLAGAIASMAAACGITLSDAQLRAYAEAATFGAMKQAAEQFAPMTGTGLWKAEQDFFARGRSGEWKEKLSAAELAAFDARLAQLLPPYEAAWLVNGTAKAVG